MSQGYQTISLW